MKYTSFIILLGFICFSTLVLGQNGTFRVTNRNASSALISNNATYFHTTLPLGKVQNDFDVVNLTNTQQNIIIRKTDLILNVVSVNDKALPSYCFGLYCRNADVFSDTVTFMPGETMPLELDFFEASHAGHSFIRYVLLNQNNLNENLTIYVDYTGIVSVSELKYAEGNVFRLFPNPSKSKLYIEQNGNNNFEQAELNLKNCLGETILVEKINMNNDNIHVLELQNIKSGVYHLQIQNQTTELFHQLIVIE